jgi:flagellar basal body-associated protein FliL
MAIEETTNKNPHRIDALHIILAIAGVFAIGSVGFLIAILLQHTAAAPSSSTVNTIQPVTEQVSTSTKETILESLNGTSTHMASIPQSSTSTVSSTSSKSTTDAQTAAKLKILQSLNAH